jgi:ElaB/YqjD/DUF883 family membrane-anchored ribosome-binding protein
MKNMRNGARTADPMDMLRHDIAAIRDDLAALVSGRLGAVSDRTRETIGRAGENVRDAASHAVKRAHAMHESLGETASNRPLTTIMLAAAAGVIFVKFAGWFARR